jgi:single-strand DNA-binding protein
MQKYYAQGTVESNPVVTNMPNGKRMAKFQLICEESYYSKDGLKTITDIVPVVLWGRKADAGAINIKKGDNLLVVGKIKTVMMKQGDISFPLTEVYADSFDFLKPRRGGDNRAEYDEEEESLPNPNSYDCTPSSIEFEDL